MYEQLLIALKKNKYISITSNEYINACNVLKNNKIIILRHDVDHNSRNCIEIANLERKYNLRAIYYFRNINGKFDKRLISMIERLNHEIGYHYEVLAKTKGDFDKAIDLFSYELEELRGLTSIKTACMHGSPLSKWDNKKLWDKYNYNDFDIQFEPYFDIDFNKVFYLTDTGRRWNEKRISLRDKVRSKFEFRIKSTSDIIRTLNNDELPEKLMINCHPHRWNDKLLPWLKELIWQNIKNIGKRILINLS